MYDSEYCELTFELVDGKDVPTETAYAYPVLIRLVDDEVVDIYGTNKVAEIAAPQALLDAWKEAQK